MNLFLHIRLSEDKFRFHRPLTVAGYHTFDLDNYSSPEVVDTALKAIERAHVLMVFTEGEAGSGSGFPLKIANRLRQITVPCHVGYTGVTPSVEMLLKKLGANPLPVDQLFSSAQDFLNRSAASGETT